MALDGNRTDDQGRKAKPWRLLLLLLLMLMFCFGLWSLAQDLPVMVDGGDRIGAGELPEYAPPSADGDRPGWDGPVFHDPPPPPGSIGRDGARAPAPDTASVERTVGTVGNPSASGAATVRTMPKEIPAGMRYPGRVAPAKQIAVGKREVDWTFVYDGEVHRVHTTIEVGAGNGLRRPAHVATFDDAGNLLVEYEGTAFLDKDGIAQVDSRNQAITGPMADQWSPDSFAIDQYGYMHSLDDMLQTGSGFRSGGPEKK